MIPLHSSLGPSYKKETTFRGKQKDRRAKKAGKGGKLFPVGSGVDPLAPMEG
jgi:hypothetical protein